MRTRSTILSAIFLVASSYSLGQESDQKSSNNKSTSVGLPRPNINPGVYSAMQNIWYSNERISYLAIPRFICLEKPAIPLREGEGKSGYLFEGSVYHQALILMGRNHGNHLMQTSRMTFDYGVNIRITTDQSYPQIPSNYIFGFTYKQILWDSYTKLKPFSRSMAHAFSDWNSMEQPLSTLSINITGHHYSNGQPPGFFCSDTVNGIPIQRNDYLVGDFTTNYLQIGLTYSIMCPKRCILSFKIAYQFDGDFIGPFSFSEELKKSYGQQRLLGFAQYRLVWRKLNKRKTTIPKESDPSASNASANLPKYYELLFRLEYEYITGDLSLYPHTNKYRFNPRFYAVFTRPNWKDLGFIFQCYYGRDYANVRYDLPVFAFLGGISINFNKYIPPFSERQMFQ